MKKIIVLLGLSLIYTSCSDGDIAVKSMNFNEASIQNCGSLFFKINQRELLIADFAKGSSSVQLDVNAPLGELQTFQTSSANPIYYRVYSDNVNAQFVCASIPPAQPVVVSEYVSEPGAIVQYTKRMHANFSAQGAAVNYFFDIQFVNLTLSNEEGKLKYENYFFGSYQYGNRNLSFVFNNPMAFCLNKIVFAGANAELVYESDNEVLPPTEAGTQQYALSESTPLIYSLYEGSIVSQESCDPKTNALQEQWVAHSGTLEVQAQTNNLNSNIQATYILKNATLTKQGVSFFVEELVLRTEIF